MDLSEKQIQHLYVLIDDFDLSFEQAKKIYAEIPVEKIFENNQITEDGKTVIIEVMKRLYSEKELGSCVYYLL